MRPNDHLDIGGGRGVTLVELLVALTLFGVVATLMLTVLRGQQRFHVGALQILDTKRSAQQAVELLYGQLRAASSADIYAMSDSSITFRATHGTSHVCAIDSGRSTITLPSMSATADRGLSSFLTTPRAGDSLLILDLGDTPRADDDRWRAHVIASDPQGGACPLRPHGLAANPRETAAMALTISPPLDATAYVGMPVRFFRPARYSLYRSSTEWMLGYSACAAGSCSVRQPLSGPYQPFTSDGSGGLAFRYADAHAAPTSDPSRVARIDVVARARSTSVLDVAHIRNQHYQDSLAITIALRNPL